ncbi:acyl-CoA dehydratase activase [Eubacteriaceae bacterium ES3]|nr:acyl-CoA dehydratase activase [Eubacteriaceae bacterium ES3]
MISIGIDCGNQNTKGVLLKDGQVIAKASVSTAFDNNLAGEAVFEALLEGSKIKESQVEAVGVTGAGRTLLSRSGKLSNEVQSAARGGRFFSETAQMIIDMGAEGCRVIKLRDNGTIEKYETNDKCASGAGMFVEAMARALQISVDEMGDYSKRHKKKLTTNAQCVVFAESEVISLVHNRETVEDIAYGVHMGVVTRIASLIRRVGLPENVMFIGGPGHNEGLVACMEEELERSLVTCPDTDYISSIGAALIAEG